MSLAAEYSQKLKQWHVDMLQCCELPLENNDQWMWGTRKRTYSIWVMYFIFISKGKDDIGLWYTVGLWSSSTGPRGLGSRLGCKTLLTCVMTWTQTQWTWVWTSTQQIEDLVQDQDSNTEDFLFSFGLKHWGLDLSLSIAQSNGRNSPNCSCQVKSLSVFSWLLLALSVSIAAAPDAAADITRRTVSSTTWWRQTFLTQPATLA